MTDEQRRRLEAKGYSFDVKEEPVTEPKSDADHFYRVTISHEGVLLGTRSEMQRERALERAYNFAQKHDDEDREPRGLVDWK